MSLEQTVANLATAAQALMALPSQITALATAKIAEITAAYLARLASLSLAVFVDPVNGLDTNTGLTEAQALRTINAAVAMAPRGGRCSITLLGPITISSEVVIDGKSIEIKSGSSTRHAITFEKTTIEAGGTTFRIVHGFRLREAVLELLGLTIVEPDMTGVNSGLAIGNAGYPFRVVTQTSMSLSTLKISACDVAIPATKFGALISTLSGPLALILTSVTATDQPLNGRLLEGVAVTTGTDVVTLPYLLCNLAKV